MKPGRKLSGLAVEAGAATGAMAAEADAAATVAEEAVVTAGSRLELQGARAAPFSQPRRDNYS